MDGTLRQTLVHENIQWPTGQHCNSTHVSNTFTCTLDNPTLWSCLAQVTVFHSISIAMFLSTRLFLSASTGLAVDYFNERLYWADAKLSVIGSVRLDGSDPVVAVSGIKNS